MRAIVGAAVGAALAANETELVFSRLKPLLQPLPQLLAQTTPLDKQSVLFFQMLLSQFILGVTFRADQNCQPARTFIRFECHLQGHGQRH